MSVEKKCSACSIVKSIINFYKQKNGLLGRTAECKECRKKRSLKWGNENKEKKNAQAKIRRQFEDRKEYNRKWREENPNYFKEYYKQNSKSRIESNKRFWKNHPGRYESFKIYQNARRKNILNNPNKCQICGIRDLKIQAHHFDYSKPLEVTWVCMNCHKDIHRKMKFT